MIQHEIFGSGKDVIFLHGWGGNKNSFSFLASFLSQKFRVTVVELYGFGATGDPPRPYSLDDYVLSVMEIVHYYKMQDITLICHSFGGRIGIKLAYKYGYMVDKLILMDSAGMKPHRNLRYYASILRHKICRKIGIPHTAGSADYRILSPVMKKTFVKIVNEHLDWLLDFIQVPVLLIWGNKDKETPIYMGKRLLRHLQDSAMVVMEGCGHFAYLERPYLVASIVDSFVSGAENELDSCEFGRACRKRRIVHIPDGRTKSRL